MRRVIGITAAIALALAVIVTATAGGDDGSSGDHYYVRAVFDNGSFVVPGEDVRVAGANVGTVADTDVSLPGEVVSTEPGREEQAGKAIVVLDISDPGFQDFKEDASCILRPQSLIGERYVNCQPTAPSSLEGEPQPSLEPIPDDQPGAGQYLLPLDNNGTTVDIDSLQNLSRAPYAERFRLILNELGIGFAARGEDVAHIVERADPTLRQVNRVLAILAGQSHQLTKLAKDSETILEPLSRERTSVTGFMHNSGIAAQATAERRPELEEALQKFPIFLRELRSTMTEFQGFSDAALPVTEDLGDAAPSLTRATKLLAPFGKSSEIALDSFGDAAEGAGPLLKKADPIVQKAGRLAKTGVDPTRNLQAFLRSTRKRGGFEQLMKLIYNTNASVNGFDSYGHIIRTMLVASNCVDYAPGYQTGCDARWAKGAIQDGPPSSNFPGLTPMKAHASAGLEAAAAAVGTDDTEDSDAAPEVPVTPDDGTTTTPEEPDDTTTTTPTTPAPDGLGEGPAADDAQAQADRKRSSSPGSPDGTTDLLNFLIGP